MKSIDIDCPTCGRLAGQRCAVRDKQAAPRAPEDWRFWCAERRREAARQSIRVDTGILPRHVSISIEHQGHLRIGMSLSVYVATLADLALNPAGDLRQDRADVLQSGEIWTVHWSVEDRKDGMIVFASKIGRALEVAREIEP